MGNKRDAENLSSSTPTLRQTRRRFLRMSATGLAIGATGLSSTSATLLCADPSTSDLLPVEQRRAKKCFEIRRDAALLDRNLSAPSHANNGDETKYADRIGSFTKGLPHDEHGIVKPLPYDALLDALRSGEPKDFEAIPLGGTVRLVNPQAGLTFDLEGMDSHQSTIAPAPAFASAERAGEAVECYWMAVLRDLNFAEYATNERAHEACRELSRLSDFRGPKVAGKVTPANLFRGFTPGDPKGPYISQFLLHSFDYGAIPLKQKIKTFLPIAERGADFLTDADSWLEAQNGRGPFAMARLDTTPRYIRNGRDLTAYVHLDHACQAFINASLFFNYQKLPVNAGNPYRTAKVEAGFATFGLPHIQSLLGQVSGCALRAVWFQKWFVHRTLRPEEFGGRLHFALTNKEVTAIQREALESNAVEQVYADNGSYLLPQAFPEGCPQHPSYGQGHAAVAGACATLLKAFLDEKRAIVDFANVVQPNSDGLSLVPYAGDDAGQLTLGSELDKLAGNIAMGRNHAGIHWRSDYVGGLLLGEAVTIAILRDQKATFTEDFKGLTFTKFDGTVVTV